MTTSPKDGVPAFDPTQPCSPTLTQCPRCKNPHHACDQIPDGVAEVDPPPTIAAPDARLQELAHEIKRLGLEIFDGPECPQMVRDAIEWFAAELSVSTLPDGVGGPDRGEAMKVILDRIEHLLCVASDAGKAEAGGDTATAERLDMELKRGIEALEQALAPAQANADRLAWLHGPESHNVDGWEWGIFRVRWLNDGRGNVAEVLQTGGDFSDLDAAMRTAGVPVAGHHTDCSPHADGKHEGK